MNAQEILDKLSELKHIEVSIFRFNSSYGTNQWDVNFKYKEEGVEVKIECQNKNWELALELAWERLNKVARQGTGMAMLSPPVDTDYETVKDTVSDSDPIPF